MQITEKASSKYEQTTTEEMSVVPAPVAAEVSENIQTGLPKNMVSDSEWFDGDRMKFEDWWREMRLFLKSNRIMETDNRITAILAHLRGGVVRIYAQ